MANTPSGGDERETSLRERKKAQTRALLIDASQRLFAAQGYANTTLEQIADAASVSVPTVLAYFRSKDRLALAPDYDLQEGFHSAVTDPERAVSTKELWREHLSRGAGLLHNEQGPNSLRAITAPNPDLLAAGRLSLIQCYEETLAIGLARDVGTVPANDLDSVVLAAALAYGASLAARRFVEAGAKGDLIKDALAIADLTFARFDR